MKKAYILIGSALAALLVLVSCSKSGENENENLSAHQSSCPYFEGYLEFIAYKLAMNAEELTITSMEVHVETGNVWVGVSDDSEETMAKIEDVIGEEAMGYCRFGKGTSWPD